MRSLLICLAVLPLLTGCGFALRGQAELPESIRTVYVDAPSVIASELEVFLRSAGAKMATAAEGADAAIKVNAGKFDRRVLSVDSGTGKAREYELVFSTSFGVTGKDGAEVIASQPLRFARDVILDPNAVIGTTREAGVVRDEMRRDAAEQIVRRMEAALR